VYQVGKRNKTKLVSGVCNAFINRLIVSDCTFLSTAPRVFPCLFLGCKANARV